MKLKKVFETRGLCENKVVKVYESENYYAIESFMPERNPTLILSKYEYNDSFKKGIKWDWYLLIYHGHLEANKKIKPIQ